MSAQREPSRTTASSLPPEDYAKATLNILEDFVGEKARLEATQRAIVNILEDFTTEKTQLEGTQRAALNILDDFAEEKSWFENAQRATLNILEDFDEERAKVEAANRDLSEAFESLRVAKDDADAANRELDAFSYSVAHDLRAPLRAMDGFSAMLLEDYAARLDEPGREYLQHIRESSQMMARLIDDLLTLSRVSRGELRREPVNLSEIAEALAETLQAAAPERRVDFAIAPEIMAQGDSLLLQQVLQNLLQNAWKFTAKHARARIEFGRLERAGRPVYFVRDDGAGFDSHYAHKLFGVFQRLHSMQEFEGTGIGLAIVERIVRRHGGRVWAEGAVEGGAIFYFTL